MCLTDTKQKHLGVPYSQVQLMNLFYLFIFVILRFMQTSERPEVSQAHNAPLVLPVEADQ